MLGYEEVAVGRDPNDVPLLILFLYMKAKTYYKLYMFHDFIWSLIILVPGILIRVEVLELSSYQTIFGNNFAAFVYCLIGIGGIFLLFIIVFSAFLNEIPYNYAKKAYIIWRCFMSVIHLFVCMFVLIFFCIYESTFENILIQNNVSLDVLKNLRDYFNYGVSISSFFIIYSLINIYNCYILAKACLKIQGDMNSNEFNLDTQKNLGLES